MDRQFGRGGDLESASCVLLDELFEGPNAGRTPGTSTVWCSFGRGGITGELIDSLEDSAPGVFSNWGWEGEDWLGPAREGVDL